VNAAEEGSMSGRGDRWQEWILPMRQAMLDECARAPFPSAVHAEDHIDRVWRRVLSLAEELHADLLVLVAAVFLHDLGRHHVSDTAHGALSAELAEPILERLEFPTEKRDAVLLAIRTHDVTWTDDDRSTLEAKILYDADKLDTFGVVGVTRYVRRWYGVESIDFILADIGIRWDQLGLPQTRELARADYLYARDFFVRLRRDTEMPAD
jgi:HD superfamily phosphohydrolase YqeK